MVCSPVRVAAEDVDDVAGTGGAETAGSPIIVLRAGRTSRSAENSDSSRNETPVSSDACMPSWLSLVPSHLASCSVSVKS